MRIPRPACEHVYRCLCYGYWLGIDGSDHVIASRRPVRWLGIDGTNLVTGAASRSAVQWYMFTGAGGGFLEGWVP